jgi:RimJ/RimL family protein N-acetyltransferase
VAARLNQRRRAVPSVRFAGLFTSAHLRLRAVTVDDVDATYDFETDPELHLVMENRPFTPRSRAALRARLEKQDSEEPDRSFSAFTAETLDDGTVVGGGVLWGIDEFNQYAHIGLALAPAARGKGYGREIVEMLCRYGFRQRNLRRIELETFATNAAMRATAVSCGFTHEGTQRQREYDGDSHVDVVLYAMLREEWKARATSS